MKIEYTTKDFNRSAQIGNEEAIKLFLTAGMNPNSQDSADGRTALMFATWFNHITIVQSLLKNGAQINLKDKNGFSALTFAGIRR